MSGPKPELFTRGLVLDVAKVLEAHGYSPLNVRAYVELEQHLFFFLHADRGDDRCMGGVR
jgi:hypothetical protein